MENFNKIVEIVLSFDIGIVVYKGTSYFKIVNSHEHIWYDAEHLKLRRSAVTELLNIPADQADLQINRLRVIIDEMIEVLKHTPTEKTMQQFEYLCTFRDVSLTYHGNYHGVLIKSTEQFYNELLAEIDSRAFIIMQLQETCAAARGQSTRRQLIVKEPTTLNLDRDNLEGIIAHAQLWDEIKRLDPPIETSNEPIGRCDFFTYLTLEGQAILPELIEMYCNTGPKELISMLYALQDLKLLNNPNPRGYKQKDLATALSSTFKRIISPQTVSDNIKKFEYPDPSRKQDILNQTKMIKALL